MVYKALCDLAPLAWSPISSPIVNSTPALLISGEGAKCSHRSGGLWTSPEPPLLWLHFALPPDTHLFSSDTSWHFSFLCKCHHCRKFLPDTRLLSLPWSCFIFVPTLYTYYLTDLFTTLRMLPSALKYLLVEDWSFVSAVPQLCLQWLG